MTRVTAIVLVAILAAAAAGAQSFTMTLAGSREAAGTGDPNGTGLAAVSFDGTTLRYFVWAKGTAQPTASHIHSGVSGQSGPVFIDLGATFTNPAPGVWMASGAVTADLAKIQAVLQAPSAYYLNVHTGAFPAGAVRGQLLGDGVAPTAFATTILGAREPGGGDPGAAGYAVVALDGTDVYCFLTARGLATPAAVHVHAGAAGSAGPITLDFGTLSLANGTATATVTTTAAIAAAMLARPESFYVDVHTGAFPVGAVRGQLGPTATELYFPVLARNAGQGTTNFKSDARVLNLTDEDATLFFEWYPKSSGGSTGPAAVVRQSVVAGGEAVFDDVIQTLFGANDRGAVRILSAFPLRAAANTYNDQRTAGQGTFGSYVEGLGLDRAYTAGAMVFNSHRPRTDNTGFRTNLGYFNPNPFQVNVTYNVRRPDGSLIGTPIIGTLLPFANDVAAYYQVLGGIPADQQTQANFFVTYTSSAPVFLFTSIIDNVSGDSFQQPAAAVPSALTAATVPTPTPTPTVTPTPPAVTFTTIQNTIFTPICSSCHPPNGGMDLTAGNAWANVVNQPSTEKPTLMRVKPGDAANSYLYQKVTGAPGIVGAQMPRGGALTQAQIDTLRGWILAGAPNN